MDFGVAMFTTDQSADPATVALLAEQRGFESFFVPEPGSAAGCARSTASRRWSRTETRSPSSS